MVLYRMAYIYTYTYTNTNTESFVCVTHIFFLHSERGKGKINNYLARILFIYFHTSVGRGKIMGLIRVFMLIYPVH